MWYNIYINIRAAFFKREEICMGDWFDDVFQLVPFNEQERVDQLLMLDFIGSHHDVLTRKNKFGHFTATACILNEDHDKLVVVWHKIYSGWTVPGGHADGESRLWLVAETEAEEETGLTPRMLNDGKPFALQALPTLSHYHRSRGYVSAHTHFDATYLFEVPNGAELKYAPDESNGIRWLDFEMASSEMVVDFMRPVQRKLIDKLESKPYDYWG